MKMRAAIIYILFISVSFSAYTQDLTEVQKTRVRNVVKQYCGLISDYARDSRSNYHIRNQIEDLFHGEHNTTTVFDDLKTNTPIQLRDYLSLIRDYNKTLTFTFRNIETAIVLPAYMPEHPTMKFAQIEIMKDIRQSNETVRNVFVVNLNDDKIWGIAINLQPFYPPTSSTSSATAKIENIWMEHNVSEGNRKGMNIHVKFAVSGMLNKQVTCYVLFYLSDGNVLMNDNDQYRMDNGQATTVGTIKLKTNENVPVDGFLFMPYEGLQLSPGVPHRLKYLVILFDDNGKQIAISDFKYFYHIQPSSSSVTATANDSKTSNPNTAPRISASKKTLSFSSSGGSESIYLFGVGTYDLEKDYPSWFTIKEYSGRLDITCSVNSKNKSRNGYITIISEGEVLKISVNQEEKSRGTINNCFNCPETKNTWGITLGYAHNTFEYYQYLDGIQFGLRAEPLFQYGFGLNTGILLEAYTKSLNQFKVEQFALNVPLHFEYRFNFSRWFNVFAYGGAGFNVVTNSSFDDYKLPTTFEFGGGMRIDRIQINVGRSMYLGDFKNIRHFGENIKIYQNFAGSISFMF